MNKIQKFIVEKVLGIDREKDSIAFYEILHDLNLKVNNNYIYLKEDLQKDLQETNSALNAVLKKLNLSIRETVIRKQFDGTTEKICVAVESEEEFKEKFVTEHDVAVITNNVIKELQKVRKSKK